MTALYLILIILTQTAFAGTGQWPSKVTGGAINYKTTEPETPLLDTPGKHMTVVYLENLGFEKTGGNSLETDVEWLLSQGYRVIELDYANHEKAVSPNINEDIIAINNAINSGSFVGYSDCSTYRSYILFEGYRLARDVAYFKNDPAVYNWPSSTVPTDSLYMDIIYPANASVKVPAVLSFSYSNSYYNNQHSRLFLGYTLALFDDSFLEGAPAAGIAWAIADHPKYCDWGQGKPAGGDNKTYASYEVNPDAAQKVKSAVRTLRFAGETLGLSGKIGIYGFSRGSDAGSMAIGDKIVEEFENAGINTGIDDDVQAAALGSGVFDFTQIYNATDDGDGNLETRCPLAWGPLKDNYALWETMGSAYLVETSASAPTLFFYNTDDAPYYQDQITQFKTKLENLDVPTYAITDYGSGHAVPKDSASLAAMYGFFNQYLVSDTTQTRIDDNILVSEKNITIKISPNPAASELQMQFNLRVTGNLKIELCNLSGKVLFQMEKFYFQTGLKNETIHLNELRLPQGLYMVKVMSNGIQGVKRFVKN